MLAVSETEKRVLRSIVPHAEALGYGIVRVRVNGGRHASVQIMAERADGRMSVEDCAQLSRAASPALDSEEPIKGAYTLEVSSPGIDRPLTRQGDFAHWIGHKVRIETHRALQDQKRFSGTILGETGEIVQLALDDGREIALSLEQMARADLVLTEELIAVSQTRQTGSQKETGT